MEEGHGSHSERLRQMKVDVLKLYRLASPNCVVAALLLLLLLDNCEEEDEEEDQKGDTDTFDHT